MKRKLSLFFALLLSLLLVSCGGKGDASASVSAVQLTPESSAGASAPNASTPDASASDSSSPSPDASANADASSPSPDASAQPAASAQPEPDPLDEDGVYTSKEDVALYLHQYGHLPDNFITKKEARDLGWPGGNLEPYAPGMCIGGDRFGNYEKILPEASGRSYHECDIDTLGASKRGAKRIVYSTDGLIYYTEDHYETFELLYDGTTS